MELKIYENVKKVAEAPKVLRLKLKYTYDGSIKLIAVDEYGNDLPAGNLLIVHDNGSVTLPSHVSNELGLELTPCRRLKIDSQE